MIKRLKKKWGISSNVQLVVIFIVFAITGSASAKLATPFLNFLGVQPSDFVEVPFGLRGIPQSFFGDPPEWVLVRPNGMDL